MFTTSVLFQFYWWLFSCSYYGARTCATK